MRLFPNAKREKANLLREFEGKKILDVGCGPNKTPGAVGIDRRAKNELPQDRRRDIDHDLTVFPWPIEDNAYDLTICSHVIEHLPDIIRTLEELNRVTKSGGKIYLETPHYTWVESFRHYEHRHHFSHGSFDYFVKGNPYYKTDFVILRKKIFFDDFTNIIGVGCLANASPRFYEKRIAFIFPATSFCVVMRVEK